MTGKRRRDDSDDEEEHVSKWVRVQETVPLTEDKARPPRKRFLCGVPGCPAVFDFRKQLEDHVRERHTFKCKEPRANGRRCHTIFPSVHLLDIHSEEGHSGFFWARLDRGHAVIRCLDPNCTLFFSQFEARKQHVLADHQWEPQAVEAILKKVHRGSGAYRLRKDQMQLDNPTDTVAQDGSLPADSASNAQSIRFGAQQIAFARR